MTNFPSKSGGNHDDLTNVDEDDHRTDTSIQNAVDGAAVSVENADNLGGDPPSAYAVPSQTDEVEGSASGGFREIGYYDQGNSAGGAGKTINVNDYMDGGRIEVTGTDSDPGGVRLTFNFDDGTTEERTIESGSLEWNFEGKLASTVEFYVSSRYAGRGYVHDVALGQHSHPISNQ